MSSESINFIPKELDVLNKPISDALSRKLIESGERRSLIGTIPLSKVKTDHSLIDENHVEQLAGSMKSSDRGQISPTTVRARIDEDSGEIVFDVIDGFHRTEALRRNGAQTVKVSALYSCSDEELYDQRILAAQSVQSVQFARVATWMRLAFEKTPWAEKGMDVTRAFGVTLNDTKRPQRVDLDPDEVEQMKEWVRGTSDRWSKGLNQTYQTLKLVDDADPQLVERVRSQSGGKDRKAVVTPTYLKLVVNAFPGIDNFETQNAVMDFILAKRMYVPQVNSFLEQIALFIREGMSREEAAAAIINNVDLDKIGVIYEKQKAKPTGEQRRDVSRRHRKSLKEARGEIQTLQSRVSELSRENLALQEDNRRVRNENMHLRRQVAILRDQDKGNTSGDKQSVDSFSNENGNVRTIKIENSPAAPPRERGLSKKANEVTLSPEQIRENFVKVFSGFRIPTMVGGFFIRHEEQIRGNKAEPIDKDIVEALGDAFEGQMSDQETLTSDQVHAGRVEGLTLLKQFADLPDDVRAKTINSLPTEVQDLVKYSIGLNKTHLLGSLRAMASEESQKQYAVPNKD